MTDAAPERRTDAHGAPSPRRLAVGTALVLLLVLSADWGTKAAVEQSMELGERIRLLPMLNLVHVRNSGMAFSILADQGPVARWFLVAVSAALSALLLVLIVRRVGTPTELFAFQLILAGALGNLQGRVQHGFVVDFVDVHAGGYHWPAFNVADAAISVGTLVFLYATFFGGRRP